MSISSSQLAAPPESPRSHCVIENSNVGQSHWPGPGIFVRVEVGISFSPRWSRQLSFGYASRDMEDRARNQRPPESLVPRNGNLGGDIAQRQLQDDGRLDRPGRLRVRSRSALQLRTSPISPESVTLSLEQCNQRDYHPFHPEPVFHPSSVSVQDYRPSQPSQGTFLSPPISLSPYPSQHSNSYPPPQTPRASSCQMPPFIAVRQSPIDRKPLPPLPSHFRLGSDNLPWSSPTIIDPDDPVFFEPSSLSTEEQSEQPTRVEDPQQTRELEQLHQAMMGIDGLQLGNEWWEPGGSWDQQGDLGGLPRGPRGVGWAIAIPARDGDRTTREQVERTTGPHRVNGQLGPPPAYSPGQWGWDWEWEERHGYWVRGLRRRSSVR